MASPPVAVAEAAPAYRPSPFMRLPYPLRTLLHRWRGLLGMMLGVGIALSMAMTLFAVSKASLDLYTGDYRASGADVYVITQGGKMIAQLPGDTPGTIKQARRVLTEMRGMPRVNAAVGVMSWSMEREREGRRDRDEPAELISTMGVNGDPRAIPDLLVVEEGRWLRRSNEIFLGAKLSREKSLPVGGTLRLNGRDFIIVGTGKVRGFGFGTDALAYLDYDAFRDRAPVGDVINTVVLDTAQPEEVIARIPEIGSLASYTPPQLVTMAEEANASSVAINWIFSILALTIGALFVSSMLSRSVIERRLEFATLKAIGIPSATILRIVALEAILISLVASLVGIGLSLVFGQLINVYVAQPFGFDSLYAVDAAAFLTVFALAIGLGLTAGLVPARRATRVDPVDILREA